MPRGCAAFRFRHGVSVSLMVLSGFFAAVAMPAAGRGAPGESTGDSTADSRTGLAAAAAPEPSYAALVTLADSAPLIAKVLVRKQAEVEAARAGSLAPGHGLLYLEGDVLGAVAGAVPRGKVAWLADVKLDSRGHPPQLKKTVLLAFARAGGGSVDGVAQLQLVAANAELAWSVAREDRLRAIRAELAAPNAPPHVTGVREMSYVPGELAGAGETQIFLSTENGRPAAITVEHRAGEAVRWSVSFSEVVDPSGLPPAKETLAWYRLACALPAHAPAGANISDTEQARVQAESDYEVVMAELGPCARGLD